MDISVTAEINGTIEVENLVKNTVIQTVTVVSLPAAFIGSISITEAKKSTTGLTFTITGANFDASTVITTTAGTVTSTTVNSATSVSVTFTSNSTTGYKNVTATTDAGTYTLSNCIRMYTEVIPGSTVAWGDITGSPSNQLETGNGYIRRNGLTYTGSIGASFLVTSSTTADISISMIYDNTYYAIGFNNNQDWLLGPNNNATNTSPSYRPSGVIGYWRCNPTTGTSQTNGYVQQKRYSVTNMATGGGLYASDPNVFIQGTVFQYKRINQIDYFGFDDRIVTALKGLSNTQIYFDFALAYGCGFKNIVAKVYD